MNRSDYYSNLENVLQYINREHISLPEAQERRNKATVERLLNMVVDELTKDSLFAAMFNRVFYGGSFYDGLRVGEPNEFDLDLLLKLDKAQPKVTITNIPGFVKCHLSNPQAISGLQKLVDANGYIKNETVRRWMEGLMTKVMNRLCPSGNLYVNNTSYKVQMRKSGPAVTVMLSCSDDTLDIDFVPCFQFGADQWPVGSYRANPRPTRPNFFIVPKMPKNESLPCDITILWRLSFQEQEREILAGKQFLKPAVKLLKKLRDVQRHDKVASYYIKTIFLWEATSDDSIFRNDGKLATVFLTMFEKYIEWLDNGKIPYFWNKKYNLLGVSPETLKNFAHCLKYIHRDITTHMDNPYTICRYLGIEVLEPESAATETQNEGSRCAIL